MRKRIQKWLFYLFLLCGCSFFAKGFYMQAKGYLAQQLIKQSWQKSVAEQGGQYAPWAWADTHVVARIYVPKLDIERYVLAGASGRNLAFGPALEQASSALGSDGGSVIAAHNDTHFAFVRHLNVGEVFIVELSDGRSLRYRVEQKSVLHESETHIADVPGLHLVTCYPFNSSTAGTDLRFVVSASLLSKDNSMA